MIKSYVEETSASIVTYAQPPMQLAEISALTVPDDDNLGHGGSEVTNTPFPINENSILAHNPTSTDYIEENGFKRNQISEYTVQPGDLLSFIASDYGVSVNSLIWANNLRNANSISPGQVLKIPPVSGVIHTVAKGDTVSSIAKKYKVESESIIEFNSLPQNGSLQVGYDIVVPDGQVQGVANVASYGSTARTFSYLPNLGDYFMLPATGYNWGRIHGRNGVDVANSCGTPVYAAAGGTVTLSDAVGYNGGFGQYIRIQHPNNTETLYAHGSKLLVFSGQTVQRGQKIMIMGTTGRSTGCHLHFEVHGAQNPLAR